MRKVFLIFFLCMGLLSFSACGSKKVEINLDDYLEVEIDGYDTAGYAEFYIDFDEMFADHIDSFGFTEEDEEWLLLYISLASNITGELDREENLSNGDKITFTWELDTEKTEEMFDVKFTYTDQIFTVNDLEKLEEVNPFEGVEVAFVGASPNGKMIVVNEPEDSNLSLKVSKDYGLSNGDVISLEITAKYDNVYDYFYSKGKVPTVLTKKIEVTGLDTNVIALHEIQESAMQVFHEDALNTFKTISMNGWVEEESFRGMEYVGSYLVNPKTDENVLYNIYLIDIENTESKFKYYYYKYYTNLRINSEGAFLYETSNGNIPTYSGGWWPSGEYLERGSYIYAGYEQIKDFYDAKIFDYIKNDAVCDTNIEDADFEYSDALWKDYQYVVAKEIARSEGYDNAKQSLINADLAIDAEEMLNQIKYELADEYYADLDYVKAYTTYEELGDYSDAADKAMKAKHKVVELAEMKSSIGEYYTAYSMVYELEDLGDKEEARLNIIDKYLREQFIKANVGDVVYLGTYENRRSEIKPIEWKILEKTDNRVMLFSIHNIADKTAIEFNDSRGDVHWSDCSLRKWLNEEFYNNYLNELEQQMLTETLVKVSGDGNRKNDLGYGEDTMDKVYLLSLEELDKYWKNIIPVESDNQDWWRLRTLSWGEGQTYSASVYSDKNYMVVDDYVSSDYSEIHPVIVIDVNKSILEFGE